MEELQARATALEHAVAVCHHHAPSAIIEAAEMFRKFLLPEKAEAPSETIAVDPVHYVRVL